MSKTIESIEITDKTVKLKEMDYQHGWLGKVFGGAQNAPIYIAGTVALLALATGGVSTAFMGKESIEIWQIIAPIVTGVLGFLFGKGSGGRD